MTGLDDLFDGLPKRLDVEQVAEVLGTTQRGVYSWLKSGTLPAYKIGATWVILTEDVKDMLRQGSNQHSPSSDSDSRPS